MKSHLKFVFIGLIIFSRFLLSQTHHSVDYDQKLTSEFRKMMTAHFSERIESMAPAFEKVFIQIMSKPESFMCPFDSLRQYMKIVESEDRRLRIFSWDKQSGGTWHAMSAYAQFRSRSGNAGVDLLGNGFDSFESNYADVIIYKIHDIIIQGKTYYMTFGYGTHGSGKHHTIVQLFYIEENRLRKYDSAFECGADLVVEVSRMNDVDMKYDAESEVLSHEAFVPDEERGILSAAGKRRQLSLIGGSFIYEDKEKYYINILPELE